MSKQKRLEFKIPVERYQVCNIDACFNTDKSVVRNPFTREEDGELRLFSFMAVECEMGFGKSMCRFFNEPGTLKVLLNEGYTITNKLRKQFEFLC